MPSWSHLVDIWNVGAMVRYLRFSLKAALLSVVVSWLGFGQRWYKTAGRLAGVFAMVGCRWRTCWRGESEVWISLTIRVSRIFVPEVGYHDTHWAI